MRIALVLADTPAYSETFFTSKIKGLLENGFEVVLYTRNQRNSFDLCKVVKAPDFTGNALRKLVVVAFTFFKLLGHPVVVKRFVQWEKKSNRSAKAILKNLFVNSHLLTAKADWVHFGFATLAVGSENVARAINAKMAVSFRGFDINVYPLKHSNVYDLVWKRLDRVHSISIYLWEKALTLGLEDSIPKAIITPAVVLDKLPMRKAASSVHKVVTIARFNWIKGLDAALMAIKHIKEKGGAVEYHVIGAGAKEAEERIRFIAHVLQVEEVVIFHGKKSHAETLQILKDANVYLQPSLNEGFCNAVLEAQAMGIPCVVTNGGALPENVMDGKTGRIVPVHNTWEMANALQNVLQMSESELENLQKLAVKRIEGDFSIKKQQKQFVAFYRSL
ncbi:glycosyltransferase family 4 protein [Flavobacteriaceae bacterium M23B6Z8]